MGRVAQASTLLFGSALLLWQASGTSGQTLPPSVDAGSISRQNQRIQRDIEQQGPGAAQGPALSAPARPPPVSLLPGGATIVLKSVVFDKSAFLSPGQLEAIVAPYIGKRVDVSVLQGFVNAINTLYAERGLVTASALLPPQNVKSGIVHIALVEGRLGALHVQGAALNPLEFYTTRVEIAPGEVIDVPALTSTINRFNRTGEAQIRASLQPGTSFGLTDINLAVIEPPRDLLQFFGDNLGVESVGRWEGGAVLKHYGLVGLDDRVTLYGLRSQGNTTASASYNLAVTPWGGRLGASYTHSDIRVIEGPYRTLQIAGESQTAALNLSQPLFVNDAWLFLGNAAAAYTTSNTQQSLIDISSDTTYKGTIGFLASYTGQWFSVSAAPTYSHARSVLDITGTRLDYELFNGVGQASARLPLDFIFTANVVGQYSTLPLLPGDQLFQIGGPLSVRGYPSDAFAGGSGFYGNFELHHKVPGIIEGLDVFGFSDYGTVFSTFPARTTLVSAGMGMSFNFRDHLSTELSVGFPLRHALDKQPDFEVYARTIISIF